MMDIIKQYEQFLLSQDKSPKTIESYVRDINLFIKWYSDQTNHDLNTLQQFELNDYRKELEKNAKLKTANRKIVSVNRFVEWLYNEGILESKLQLKTIKDTTPLEYKGLDEIEEKRLRKEIYLAGNKMHICLFELLRNTGIRVSELCDIELDHIIITEKKGSLKVHGKGDKWRTVSLNKTARESIQEYIKVRPTNKGNNLLIGQRGGIKRNAVDVILKKYGDKIGVNVSAHMLRHSLGYKLIHNPNVALTTIQSILGHSNMSTVAIYTQTKQKDQEIALESIE
ncbi:tyrosine-type recombinase/integrase [Heyndrickxia oleronia]|jgi:integrase/recombinase XerC|uniref:tyrosine-type recombinase/integrase n=1 Tax=Heyndrickxia oleronia TaxID=38875 RepID=UPI0024304EBC|nr:tyrosine-type recombinase/integrase [Heyndrickxia oleronia]MCI1590384.1 tyrosine-type recombinase/integrase [Heyndrickxia oleronia]MCI1611354.1 tyrosine-type recombinase/integrase [Heyndrickxia oleronia]MCI1742797.1 tyrosine-type recombinase/integrase [Heyndrickxia oleronia]MCI1763118.1 tyrosine-type recombinase/integrase [Heyndrickxia oleronia]